MEDLQRKELEDQLEAEAYFSGLYKTQVYIYIYIHPGKKKKTLVSPLKFPRGI